MKAPILQGLNLTEQDICLAAFLSDNGPAAYPHASRQGHERADSPAHVFSEEVLALRPTFETHPFKVQRAQVASRVNRRASSQGRGRPVPAQAAPVPRLQYRSEPPAAAPVAHPNPAANSAPTAAASE